MLSFSTEKAQDSSSNKRVLCPERIENLYLVRGKEKGQWPKTGAVINICI